MPDFVHLHVHTEFSLLDGACRLGGLVSRVKELGQSACAITDHGVMYGAVDFYKLCIENGIKPIIGCEVYVAAGSRLEKNSASSPYHLVLLCKNNIGYHNLTKLVSDAFTEGFYNKPRCDIETLRKYHDGLICLSACLAGEVPRRLSEGDYEQAKKTALLYRDIFGDGNYYLEVQNHNIRQQIDILPYIYRISDETGIPLVATNDAHYIKRDDSEAQHILTCIATNTTVNDEKALSFPTDEFYIKSGDEMAQLFRREAIENTVKIAEKCNISFEFGVTKLPYYHIEGCDDNAAYFRNAVNKGAEKRYSVIDHKIRERIEYETEIIIKMGYVDYFLIVADFINYARSQDIPVGPGRGSGVGSICAYCIGITSVDPLRFNLLFERFLNPERVSMPDFDVDFCYIRRQEVIDYVGRKYGQDHVAQIVTFGTLAARQAIRDCARAMGLPYAKADRVAKLIPWNTSIARSVETEKDLAAIIAGDNEVRKLVDSAKKIEGMPRHCSIHAAGVVITRDPVNEYVPLQKNGEDVVTQYTMGILESLGLLKMDFLGLRYLTVIDDCCKSVKETNPDFDIIKIDENDADVYTMLSSGNTAGVFQFESEGMTNVLSRLKPQCLEDLIATISLYRPGPMSSIPTYIENKNNPDKIVYKHFLLKDILDVTYGCIVYQEQVMQICRKLGGYSYGRADLVRRAMAKKKKDVMEKERDIFVAGAGKNGVDEKTANDIFDDMAVFATYAFNKSHATAYALLSYQTAYLRCHYYKEYMIALLTSCQESTGKLCEYISELGKQGIKLLHPDVNRSFRTFSAEDNGIRYGLLAIKNLGWNFIDALIDERRKGDFTGLFDFCSRMADKNMNKKGIEALIKSGAFDSLGHKRRQMFMAYEGIIDYLSQNNRQNLSGQLGFFADSGCDEEFSMPDVPEFPKMQLLQMEKESVGIYISGHPVDDYSAYIQANKLKRVNEILNKSAASEAGYNDENSVSFVAMLVSKKNHISKDNKMMCFSQFEDAGGSIEVIIFSKLYEPILSDFTEGGIYRINGKISLKDEEDAKIIADSIVKAKDFIIKKQKTLFINIASGEHDKLDRIMKLLRNSHGGDKVRICFSDTKKVTIPSGINGINISTDLKQKLASICGISNIIIK